VHGDLARVRCAEGLLYHRSRARGVAESDPSDRLELQCVEARGVERQRGIRGLLRLGEASQEEQRQRQLRRGLPRPRIEGAGLLELLDGLLDAPVLPSHDPEQDTQPGIIGRSPDPVAKQRGR
jgi:hypothetical protein